MTNPRRAALAAALLAARQATGLSGNQFRETIGWTQSRVSRLESGSVFPSAADIEAWAAATGVDPGPLRQLLEDATARSLRIRDAGRRPGGVLAMQGELEALELGSTTVAEYQPLMVPGLAQTPDYTREWLSQPGRPSMARGLDVDAVVARRAQRQALVLDGQRTVVVAMNEAALSAVYGTEATLRAQVAHLRRLADDGLIELLIEPRSSTLAVLRGFELLDDLVSLEDVEGLRLLGDPVVVDSYRAALAEVRRRSTPA